MKLLAHELYDLNELTLSCVNSITNMAYMLVHIKDPELKSILERHFPYHIQDYNMKVEFINNYKGTQRKLPTINLENDIKSILESIGAEASSVQPRTIIDNFDDREMATSYLLTLKRAGREYAWAAMETGNLKIREFLETAFLMSSAHAYEVWQYMVKKGYYPVQAAEENIISKIGSMYKVVPENANTYNHYNQSKDTYNNNEVYKQQEL
jgi:spore coat protein CotF